MFALTDTVHTTTQSLPDQLVFGHGSILNQHHNVDWESVKKRKQELVNKGNVQENKKHRTNMYQTGDKVLLRNAWKTKFNQNAYLGPYAITAVRDNGSVRARKGRITDTFNICNLTLYKE